jgi:hypothetical protein
LQTAVERARFAGMRYALISALALCPVVAQAIPQAAPKRKIPCKTPENASSCYWTHGRLNFYNGNPSYRIWKIGTKRIVAVYSGPDRYPPQTDADSQLPEFPREIDRVFRPPNNTVYADFEICSLEPERHGEMQAVCIESARKIVVDGFRPKQP